MLSCNVDHSIWYSSYSIVLRLLYAEAPGKATIFRLRSSPPKSAIKKKKEKESNYVVCSLQFTWLCLQTKEQEPAVIILVVMSTDKVTKFPCQFLSVSFSFGFIGSLANRLRSVVTVEYR